MRRAHPGALLVGPGPAWQAPGPPSGSRGPGSAAARRSLSVTQPFTGPGVSSRALKAEGAPDRDRSPEVCSIRAFAESLTLGPGLLFGVSDHLLSTGPGMQVRCSLQKADARKGFLSGSRGEPYS